MSETCDICCKPSDVFGMRHEACVKEETQDHNSEKTTIAREFWIAPDEPDSPGDIRFGDALIEHPRQGPLEFQSSLIHVIEKSAYDKLAKLTLPGSARMTVEKAHELMDMIDSQLKTIEELKRQKGVACLKHDLVHHLSCGRCSDDKDKTIEALKKDVEMHARVADQCSREKLTQDKTITELKAALEFYADRSNWATNSGKIGITPIWTEDQERVGGVMKKSKKTYKKRDGRNLSATVFEDGDVNLTVQSNDGSMRVIVLTDNQRRKLIDHLRVVP